MKNLSNFIGDKGKRYATKYLKSIGYKIIKINKPEILLINENNSKIAIPNNFQLKVLKDVHEDELLESLKKINYTINLRNLEERKNYLEMLSDLTPLSKNEVKELNYLKKSLNNNTLQYELNTIDNNNKINSLLSSIDIFCENSKKEALLVEVKAKILNPKERISHRKRFQINSWTQLEAFEFILNTKIKFELIVVYFNKYGKFLSIEKYDKKNVNLSNDKRFIEVSNI